MSSRHRFLLFVNPPIVFRNPSNEKFLAKPLPTLFTIIWFSFFIYNFSAIKNSTKWKSSDNVRYLCISFLKWESLLNYNFGHSLLKYSTLYLDHLWRPSQRFWRPRKALTPPSFDPHYATLHCQQMDNYICNFFICK